VHISARMRAASRAAPWRNAAPASAHVITHFLINERDELRPHYGYIRHESIRGPGDYREVRNESLPLLSLLFTRTQRDRLSF